MRAYFVPRYYTGSFNATKISGHVAQPAYKAIERLGWMVAFVNALVKHLVAATINRIMYFM